MEGQVAWYTRDEQRQRDKNLWRYGAFATDEEIDDSAKVLAAVVILLVVASLAVGLCIAAYEGWYFFTSFLH